MQLYRLLPRMVKNISLRLVFAGCDKMSLTSHASKVMLFCGVTSR